MTTVLIAVLGGVGAAARFVVDGLVRSRWSGSFPLATLLVNVLGSLALGLLLGAAGPGGQGSGVVLVLGVGFCGGFTTFSTAMVETVRLVQAGDPRRAAAYVLGSATLSVLGAALGVVVGGLLR